MPGLTTAVVPFLLVYGVSYFFTEFGPNMTTFVMPSELYPVTMRATGHGISAGVGKLGAFIGVFLFPLLQTSLGLRGTLLLTAGVAVAGLRAHPGAARARRAQPGRHSHQHARHSRPAAAGGRSGISTLRILSPACGISQWDHAGGTCRNRVCSLAERRGGRVAGAPDESAAIAGLTPLGGASAACWCLPGFSSAGAGQGSHVTFVLIVEDEESISDALAYMLRKEGFEVAVCPTGPDALEAFDRNGADLVLLDLMLPGQLAPKYAGACANGRMCR